MIKYFAIAFLCLFALLSSCTETQEEPSTQQLINEIDAAIPQAAKQDDQTLFWKNMLNQDRYASDNVAKTCLNFRIGLTFFPSNLDSSDVYMTKALILIEDVEGFAKVKAQVYNGLAVNAYYKGKSFLSSFYSNKAVSVVDANPIGIPVRRKVRVYLYAAQNYHHIGLKESSYELAKKAGAYLDSLSEDDELKVLIYIQLSSSSIFKKIDNDSIFYYLEKIAQYSTSAEYDAIYYANKALFFEQNEQFDSAIVYRQKCIEIWQNELKDEYTTPGNRYTSYCALLKNTLHIGKMDKTDSIMSKLSEIEKEFSTHLDISDHLLFEEVMMNYYYKAKNLEKYHEATKKFKELTEEKQQKAELQAKEEMHTMYQLEENKRSIKNLNQSVEIKDNELQKTKYFLAITILAILIILAILAILYYRQKSRKLQQEYEKVILEQKLLRTQMEPHFIFNTLSTLQSLIRFQEPKKAIDYLNRFSRLLRSNLELSRQEMISLEDEIETMDNYLGLQQARFEDYFTYQIQLPDGLEVDALFIPPMLIQPFVENSILHGFDGEKEWHIEIKITELTEAKQLQIEIIDNGVGINTVSKKNHKSLSGEIAKERLEILSKKYKIPTDYQIFSEQGKGTTVCLKLPIIDGFQQN
ncbi:histidine kinase [Bernardetia sp. MNP-M8]|uniref:sensor histidine kinase n=1 Tax=Bernardetia sp. MNP-M8 TaxID=3127470 RepID=UPI0030CF0053